MTSQRITGRKTVWEHESRKFRVDEITVESGSAPPIRWATWERGDSVAALLVNTDTNHVFLIKQLRPPVAPVEPTDAVLTETVAGMIRQNEEPLQCLQREVEEETGYKLVFDARTGSLANTQHICTYYVSPGGSSERVFLYYVAIDGTTERSVGGGDKDVGEEIETELVPIDEFFARVDQGAYKDAKIIIAGQWLAKFWKNQRRRPKHRQEFAIKSDRGKRKSARIMGYFSDDIGEVTDIDIWVNSSNAEFVMDTIYQRTLSARIRTLGAKVSGDVVVDDTLQDELRSALGIGRGFEIGNVLVTGSGALRKRNNVRCLLHVASVKARINAKGHADPTTSISDLVRCVENALGKCDELNQGYMRRLNPFTSILLPLFGGGIDRDPNELKTRRLCQELIPAAVRYLESHPESHLERVYFLAFTGGEIESCDSVMSRMAALERIHEDEAPAASRSAAE